MTVRPGEGYSSIFRVPAADDPSDLCAHGRVELRVGDTVFVRPEDGDWTVSAANASAEVRLDDWRAAVLCFAREGWAEFWREWRERVSQESPV